MTNPCVTSHVQDQVLIVTIDRPHARNAIDVDTHHALADVFDRFERDAALRVAIITGSGTQAFCAGSDIKDDLDPAKKPASGFAGLSRRSSLTKPVIAAVNGAALGGGVEILLTCDMAVAVDSARFALPEPRVGLAAIEGGIQRLARHIPYKFAMQMLLTGEAIDAQTALRFGLINEIVAREHLMQTALRHAHAMLRCSPLAIETTKRVVLDGMKPEPSCWKHPSVDTLWASADAKEGVSAFAEKRAPRWCE